MTTTATVPVLPATIEVEHFDAESLQKYHLKLSMLMMLSFVFGLFVVWASLRGFTVATASFGGATMISSAASLLQMYKGPQKVALSNPTDGSHDLLATLS